MVADPLSIMKLNKVLSCIDAHNTSWNEANTLFLIKSVRTRPEFLLIQFSAKVVLESGPIVNWKSIISNNSD